MADDEAALAAAANSRCGYVRIGDIVSGLGSGFVVGPVDCGGCGHELRWTGGYGPLNRVVFDT